MANGIQVPAASMDAPRATPSPQVNTYQPRVRPGGQIEGRFTGGPGFQANTSSGEGLAAFGRGLGAVGNALEVVVQRKQNIEAMANVNDFRDRERQALSAMQEMKGLQGAEAAYQYMMDFYDKEGPELLGKSRGLYQERYYTSILNQSRDSGLNTAMSHAIAQEDLWSASEVGAYQNDIFMKAANDPDNFDMYVADYDASVDVANPGLNNSVAKMNGRNTMAVNAVKTAMMTGNVAKAQEIANTITDPVQRYQLGQALQTMQHDQQVEFFVQDGFQALENGEIMEYLDDLQTLVAQKKMPASVVEDATTRLNALMENNRKRDEAAQKATEAEANEEITRLMAENELTVEKVTALPISEDKKQDLIKEMRKGAPKGLNSPKGQELEDKMRAAILSGDILPGDEPGIRAYARALDPDVEYLDNAAIDRINKWSADPGPLKAVFEAMAKNGGPFYNQPMEALKFTEAALNNLRMNSIAVTDPQAVKLVNEWQKTDKVDIGNWFDVNWYDADMAYWPRVGAGSSPVRDVPTSRWSMDGATAETPAGQAAPSPTPGVTGGGSGGVMGASALAPGALADLANDPAVWEQFATDTAARQGLPATTFASQWAQDALDAGTTTRETNPKFAEGWGGKGDVTLRNLGNVNNYDALTKKYALSQGIDPNLLAAMMYVESKGDPYAVSEAGAVGLMQFMPKTAAQYGITNRRDPEQSIRGAAQYMRDLLDMFGGNVAKAVMSYNGGQGNIQAGRIPAETRNYVKQVIGIYRRSMQGQPQQTAGVGGIQSPLKSMLVTSKYGSRNTGIPGASKYHEGIDLRAPKGTPVSTVLPGVVIESDFKGKNGNYVVVDHGGGRRSYYLHLDKRAVKKGDRVGGDSGVMVVGTAGNTGKGFGKPLADHLDFRFWDNGKFIDPATLFTGLQYKKGA